MTTTEPRTSAPATSSCACCGDDFSETNLARLGCRDDVALCSDCLAWLGDQLATKAGGFRSVAPVLPVADLERALTHYQALGFGTGRHISGGCGYAHRDGIQIHFGVVAGHDPAGNTAGAYLHVADADALHARWAAADVAGALTAPADTDYGLREGAHVDPDGNTVRFGSPTPSPAADVP